MYHIVGTISVVAIVPVPALTKRPRGSRFPVFLGTESLGPCTGRASPPAAARTSCPTVAPELRERRGRLKFSTLPLFYSISEYTWVPNKS